MTYSKF